MVHVNRFVNAILAICNFEDALGCPHFVTVVDPVVLPSFQSGQNLGMDVVEAAKTLVVEGRSDWRVPVLQHFWDQSSHVRWKGR